MWQQVWKVRLRLECDKREHGTARVATRQRARLLFVWITFDPRGRAARLRVTVTILEAPLSSHVLITALGRFLCLFWWIYFTINMALCWQIVNHVSLHLVFHCWWWYKGGRVSSHRWLHSFCLISPDLLADWLQIFRFFFQETVSFCLTAVFFCGGDHTPTQRDRKYFWVVQLH